MSRHLCIFLICSVVFLLVGIPDSPGHAQCSKEGDPAFYVWPDDTVYALPNTSTCHTYGATNFGFVSSTCPDTDTFCVHATDTRGWVVTGDPTLGNCYLLDPGYLWWQDICIAVPCEAAPGELDTVTAVMGFCNDDLECVYDCGDCENPNWYAGNPYYSTHTFIIKVTQPPPALYIMQDSLTLIDQGSPYAGVLFSICNGDPCTGTVEYGYQIQSRGHVGPPVDTAGTVNAPSGECVDVIAILDATEADMDDLDTLTIVAWTMDEPAFYDTCVQIVRVVEPVFVPLLSTPVLVILVLAVILTAALFMRRRSVISSQNLFIAALCACAVAVLAAGSEAREKKEAALQIEGTAPRRAAPAVADPSRGFFRAAAVDTYTIVRFDFNAGDWQGWTRFDKTAQRDTFFHVDDFDGLGGGDWGRLYPLEGSKSMWCGARPVWNEYMCAWVDEPGYGNGWNQSLVSEPLWIPPPATLSLKLRSDTEPDYDYVHVQYDAGEYNWIDLATYQGVHDSIASHTVMVYTGMDDLVKGRRLLTSSGGRTKFRIQFTSDGAWSDEDGLWQTDGACIVDSITISGSSGVVDYEDFEAASVGDKSSGIWRADLQAPFGMYSGLAYNLEDKDPCGINTTHQIVFFLGSTEPSPDYTGLFDTPFCKGAGGIEAPCQNEMVVSPPIAMTRYTTGRDEHQDAEIPPGDLPQLGGARLKFTVFRDNPVPNLVFYNWHVRDISNGCPDQWQDRTYVYYGAEQEYKFLEFLISDLIREDTIQVALGVVDMCEVWYGVYGNCAEHTPAPWFDNVEVQRWKTTGPQWYYNARNLFQDNFPEIEYNMESWVRADNAYDLRPHDDPVIDPGDSIVVSCDSPLGGGLDTTPDGLPMIFMHCLVTHLGPDAKTPPSGAVLEGTYGRYYGMDGGWTVIQGEVARRLYEQEGTYMFDLNDSLFTRGFMIEYYFEATDMAAETSTLPEDARTEGRYFEFTCLPTLSSDILYVDDYDGIGSFEGAAQNYFDQAFRAVLPDTNQPDRYDVNAPASGVSNGLGSRGKNYQLCTAYKKIIWDCGDLGQYTICDGSYLYSDKSADCQILRNWLEFSEHDCGLWILGDDVAEDLAGSSTPYAADLMNNHCGVSLVDGSYYDLTGAVISMVKGTPTGIFHHGGTPDSFYVLGDCPEIAHFDVLDTINGSVHALAYPPFGGGDYYMGIQSERTNLNIYYYHTKTMWFGSSFMNIIDAEPATPMIRYHILEDVIEWMDNEADTNITGNETPPVYMFGLEQNYPNPFNPSTTFRFSLGTSGHVKVRIFNVAGQLVKVLVDGVRTAGPHTVEWDGTNERGERIASGVYFCRMEAADFEKVRKVVLLR